MDTSSPSRLELGSWGSSCHPLGGRLHPGDRLDELVASVALLRGPGGASPRLGSRIERMGSAVELLGQPAGKESFDLGAAHALASSWLARGLDARTVLDPHYPAPLREVFDRPALLFVRGTWEPARDDRSVAVVGSRRASPEGLSRAHRLGAELAQAGCPVVSGLARGVDAAAHAGALDAAGRTHAVLGTGLDHLYPPEHAPLAERLLAAGGCLVTPFPPSQCPTRWTFPRRNRVTSGLARATVVVEGGPASGSRLQAEQALEQGRPVFLLRSLVDTEDWARELLEPGLCGTRARVLEETEELCDRLAATAVE